MLISFHRKGCINTVGSKISITAYFILWPLIEVTHIQMEVYYRNSFHIICIILFDVFPYTGNFHMGTKVILTSFVIFQKALCCDHYWQTIIWYTWILEKIKCVQSPFFIKPIPNWSFIKRDYILIKTHTWSSHNKLVVC